MKTHKNTKATRAALVSQSRLTSSTTHTRSEDKSQSFVGAATSEGGQQSNASGEIRTCAQLRRPVAGAKRQKYEVSLHRTQYNYANVIVEATSEDEAEEKAHELSAEEIGKWIQADADFYVYSVELLTGGQNND